MALKIRNSAQLKHFLYLSESKLEMMFNQVGKDDKKKVDWTFGFEFKGMSVSRKAESSDELDRYDKIATVIDFLEKAGQVGSIYEPNIYIKGAVKLRWGVYDDRKNRAEDEPQLVYFGSIDTENQVLLGLGGSIKNVLGYEGITSTHSRSSTPPLARALLRGLADEIPKDFFTERDEEDDVFRAMALAQHQLRPPTQEAEFFAVVLAQGETHRVSQYVGIDEAKVVLATPLYVALTSFPKDDHVGLIPD